MNSPADLTVQPYRLGDIEVITAPDGGSSFPLPDGFVRNADRSEVNAALEAAGMKRDEMNLVFNPVLLRMGGRTVLFDTGYGESADKGPTGPGQLRKSLASAGVSPEQIDLVVITHFHGDHIGGLLRADGGSYSVSCWYGPFPIAPLIQLVGASLSPQASRARRHPR